MSPTDSRDFFFFRFYYLFLELSLDFYIQRHFPDCWEVSGDRFCSTEGRADYKLDIFKDISRCLRK